MRRKLMERKRHAQRRYAPPAEAVRDCGHGPGSRRRQGSRQGWVRERAGGSGQATSRGPGADRAAAGAGSIAEASVLHFFRDDGVDSRGRFLSARDLLLRAKPRLQGEPGGALKRPGETGSEAACRLALELAGGILPIQGPPGSGKTYTGARMICALVMAGKKVGVTAQSHKVVRLLLDEVLKAAEEKKVTVKCGHKVGDDDFGPDKVVEFTDNAEPLASIRGGSIEVLGGTAWLWSREEYKDAVDVLV